MESSPLIITLAGEFDISNAESVLAPALQPSYAHRKVVIDFTQVGYVDSSAISVLVRKRKRRAELGFPPSHLAGLNASVDRIFRIVGLNQIWPIFDNVEDAVVSFSDESKTS